MYKQELGFIRVIAALAVIVIHVTALYMVSSRLAFGFNQVVRFAVPVFVILSGLVNFLPEVNQRKQRPAADYLRQRLTRTLWPYLIWTLVYFGITVWQSGISLNSTFFTKFLFALFTGTAYVHLYFFPVIIQMYLLYIVFLRYWMDKRPKTTLLTSFLLSLATQTLLLFNQLKFVSLPGSTLAYIVLFPAWLFYFVLGMWLAVNYDRKRSYLAHRLLPLAAGCLLTLLVLLFESHRFNTGTSSLKPDVMLYSLMIFFFLWALGLHWYAKQRIGQSVVKWMADQTLLIYLIHPLFIWLLFKIWPGIWNGKPGMVKLYLAVSALSIFMAWLISKFKYARFLGGTSYQ